MKTYYIAIGGICCRALKAYAAAHGDAGYIYFDSDRRNEPLFDSGDKRIMFSDYPYHSGCMRAYGLDLFKARLYGGELPELVEGDGEETELCFLTTSFGGFGGAVVFELADYLGARLLRRGGRVRSRIIALSRRQMSAVFPDPERYRKAHETNEADFIREYRARRARTSPFFPAAAMYLIYSPLLTPDTFWRLLELPEEALATMDIQRSYDDVPAAAGHDVFISYSSHDQPVADAVADRLEALGLRPWIATRSLGVGSYAGQIIRAIARARVFVVLVSPSALRSMHVRSEIDAAFKHVAGELLLVPFFIADTPLDEDCAYYLDGAEWIDGKTPPMEQRVEALCAMIREKTEQMG